MRIHITIFWVLLAQVVDSRDPTLPCNLMWAEFSEGNMASNDAVVTSEITSTDIKHFLVRTNVSGTYVGGTYHSDSLSGFFAVNVKEENATGIRIQDFEILSNPEDCSITWASGSVYNKFRVPLDKSSSNASLGRTNMDGTWYPGIISTNGFYGVVDDQSELLNPKEYQYLISYSTGFDLEIMDFQFDKDILGGNPTVMGYDEIQNLADTLVIQSLTHTQVLTETRSVSMSVTKTNSKTNNIGLNLGIYSRQQSKVETYSWRNQTDITTETELTISVTREIQVPANSAIIACTVIHFVDNFEASYVATGVYRAKGLSANEIYDILKADNMKNISIIDDNVVLENYDGVFKGSIALNTRFIVSPADSLTGCQQELNESNERRSKKFRTRAKKLKKY